MSAEDEGSWAAGAARRRAVERAVLKWVESIHGGGAASLSSASHAFLDELLTIYSRSYITMGPVDSPARKVVQALDQIAVCETCALAARLRALGETATCRLHAQA